jgi:hypothetical protein
MKIYTEGKTQFVQLYNDKMIKMPIKGIELHLKEMRSFLLANVLHPVVKRCLCARTAVSNPIRNLGPRITEDSYAKSNITNPFLSFIQSLTSISLSASCMDGPHVIFFISAKNLYVN